VTIKKAPLVGKLNEKKEDSISSSRRRGEEPRRGKGRRGIKKKRAVGTSSEGWAVVDLKCWLNRVKGFYRPLRSGDGGGTGEHFLPRKASNPTILLSRAQEEKPQVHRAVSGREGGNRLRDKKD